MDYDTLLGITLDESRKHEIREKSYIVRKRHNLIDLMGGKCVHCGFTDKRALQIDHVDGDGWVQRKKYKEFGGISNTMYYNLVEESYLKKDGAYQILCANCNWIKRIENREYNQKGYQFQASKSRFHDVQVYKKEYPKGFFYE